MNCEFPRTLAHIAKRKREIKELIAIDKKLKADPYDDVGKLKELENAEKIFNAELTQCQQTKR